MDSALQQITERVRAAAASGTPLCIRGGGSKDFYGQTLQGEVLDTKPLNGIVSYEPTELVVTVRAGTPLTELEAALAERGQYLPFEPPHFGSRSEPPSPPTGIEAREGSPQDSGTAAGSAATCGGMVAAGLNGPARASAGAVRDYVLGATLLNGRGELLTFGGQVMKNVAGYDVSRLMAGSLGTLGVIVEVSLKVLPVAPAEATLVFELDQSRALEQLHRWGGQPLPLNASCWVHDTTDAGGRELLFVRLRGAVAAVESACRKMTQDAGGRRIDNPVAAPDWQACRDLRLPFFTAPPAPEMGLWRLSVAQTAPVLDLPWPQFVEWHGAQRWVWAPLTAQAQLRAAAQQAGGYATLFMVPDAHEAAPVARFHPLTSPLDRIHRELKKQFDPAGIFNRGRMYADF